MDYKYECIQCCGRARDFGEAQVRKRMGGRTGVAASNPMMQVGTAGAQGGDNPMMQVGMMRGMVRQPYLCRIHTHQRTHTHTISPPPRATEPAGG